MFARGHRIGLANNANEQDIGFCFAYVINKFFQNVTFERMKKILHDNDIEKITYT